MEHATAGLDAEAQRRDVEQQHLFHVADQRGALQSGAHRDDLVGIDALVGLFSKEVRDLGLDHGHAALAAHQQDLVDVFLLDPGVVQRLLTGAEGLGR